MSHVLLITRNKALSEFCRKNIPNGYIFKSAQNLNLRSEGIQGIIVFDSQYLLDASDAIVAAAAERFAAKEGGVSLNILMSEEHRAQAFSLFPENLKAVQGILPYRLEAGRLENPVGAEWRWFLENRHRHLKNVADRAFTLSENRLLAERLAEVKPHARHAVHFPAFMQGKSPGITRFREQVLSAASQADYLFIKAKDEIPVEEFLHYYASLLRPESPLASRVIDFATTPQHMHLDFLQATKSKRRNPVDGAGILCIKNLHALGWQNQGHLLSQLKGLREGEGIKTTGKRRLVFVSSPEMSAAVKRGKFRQELYALLKKSSAEAPALYERVEDISLIAAEYIAKREFSALNHEAAEIAAKMMGTFDLSSGYRGLFLTLDLLNDLEKSKGVPVFELLNGNAKSDAFIAARSFLRERIEPSPVTLFQGLAGGDKDALSLDFVERNYIAAVCERYAWQVTEASRHLGISRKTLYDKMRRYKLARPENAGRRRGAKAS